MPGLKNRAIAGPHDYEQIPALIERGAQRVQNLFGDIDERLADSTFVVGDTFSVADITLLVTVDFAAKAMGWKVSDDHRHLQRWYAETSQRPSASA